MYEAEEVGGVVVPTDHEPTLPLKPDEEALDDPAPLVATQSAAILRSRFDAAGLVRRDHLDALLAQLLVQFIAVARLVATEMRFSGLASIM